MTEHQREINKIKKSIQKNLDNFSSIKFVEMPMNKKNNILVVHRKPVAMKSVKVQSPKFKKEIRNYRVEVREIEPQEFEPHFHITAIDEAYSIRIKDCLILEPKKPRYLRKNRKKLIRDIWENNYEELCRLWNSFGHIAYISEYRELEYNCNIKV